MKRKRDLLCVRLLFVLSFVFIGIGFLHAQPASEFIADANTMGLWHFNDGSGTTAYDASGNGLDGSLYGNVGWIGGEFGQAVQFPHATTAGDAMLEGGFWIKKRTPTFSAIKIGICEGAYSSANPGFQIRFGQHNMDMSWYFRVYDINGDLLSNHQITWDESRWIHVTMARTTAGQWTIVWDQGGANELTDIVTDSFTSLTNPYFAMTPVGYYSVTGGFYVDDLSFNTRLNGHFYTMNESWSDGDWTANPTWSEYDNQAHNFTINTTVGHAATPCLEGFSGNTGTDYTALYTSLLAEESGPCVYAGSSSLLRPSIVTCEAWVYADSVRPNEMLIVTSAKDYHGYALMLWDGGKPAFDCQNGARHIAVSPDPLPLNSWHHLAGTFDGETVSIFVDGELKAGVAGSLSPATFPLVIGADVTPNYVSDPFRGRIDEVRISDIVRYAPRSLQASFWLHRRTPTFSILKCGFSEGTYTSTNVGVRMFFGEHNLDGLEYMRFWDENGNQLLNRQITYPSDRWIKVSMERFDDGRWTLIWDDGGPSMVVEHVADSFESFADPYFWITPVGFYAVTGGVYLDDIHIDYTHAGTDHELVESWDDGNWTCSPHWYEYDNQANNFGFSSTMGHTSTPGLECWSGNTGTDYTALYAQLIQDACALNVTEPGTGTEWWAGQTNAQIIWNHSENCCGNLKIDLYRSGSFLMNIATAVDMTADLHSWNLPSFLCPGTDYQVYIQSNSAPELNDTGDMFTIHADTALTGEFIPDANTIGLWHMNECVADPAYDATANHINGVTTGAAVVDGVYGNALHFSYPGDRVNLGTTTLLRPSIVTCEAWVYADSIRPNEMLIITSAKDFRGYALMLWDGGKPAFDCQNGTRHIAVSPDPLPLNEWHHLAGTFDGQYVRIFVDGVPKARVAGGLNPATYPVIIGTDVTPPYVSDPFRGIVDEVRISNCVRYFDDFIFHLDECSGTTVSDVNNNIQLTLNGDANWTSQGAHNCALDLTSGHGGTNPGNYTVGNGWDQLTVEAWVKLNDPMHTVSQIVTRYNWYTNASYYLFVGREGGHYGGLHANVYTGPGTPPESVTASSADGLITDNCWHHVAFTYNMSDSLKLWLDGVVVARVRANGHPVKSTSDPLRFGCNPLTGYSDPFNGYLDEVRIARTSTPTPECAPLSPTNLVVQIQGMNARLMWSPVTQNQCGYTICPDLYLVFFESTDGEDPDFLGYTTQTTYTHSGVVQFSPHMYYSVQTYMGDTSQLQTAISVLGINCKRSALVRYLNRD